MKYASQKELEDKSRERLNSRWDSWSEYYEPYLKAYQSITEEYMCEQDEISPNTKRRSRLKYPYLFTLIETMKPVTIEALVGERPYIGTAGRHEEDDAPSKLIQGHQTYMLDEAQFPMPFSLVEHMRLLYGLTFAFAPWMLRYGLRRREIEEMVQTLDPMTGLPKTETIKKKVEREFKTKDNIEFIPVEPWMIRFDPTITDAKDLMWGGEGVIREWFTTPEEVKSLERKKRPDGSVSGIYNPESVKECLKNWDESKDEANSQESKERNFDFGHTDSDKQFKGKLKLREAWMKLPVVKNKTTRKGREVEELQWDDDASLRECVVTICVDTSTTLRVVTNPTDEQFRPFLGATCYPVPGRLPGISFGRIVKGLMKEMEILKNSRLDYINFILRRPWVVNIHSGIQIRDSFNVPDRIIKARDINGIKPLDAPDYSSSVYRDISGIDYEIQNASGVMSMSQDTSKFGQGFGETATGIGYFQQLMGARLKQIVRCAEYQMMVPLGTMLFLYAKQFVTQDSFFRVMNSENPYMVVGPEAYSSQIDFIPAGAHDRVTKGQQTALMDRFLTILPTLRDLIRVEEVIKDYMKLTGIAPNPAKYMISPEEQAQRAKMMQGPNIDPKLSLSFKGEDLDQHQRAQVLMKEYGIQPLPQPPQQVPNVLMPQGVPTLPGQIVNSQGIPGGVNGAEG